MNYKNIVVFILLFFIQSIPATQPPPWLSAGNVGELIKIDPKVFDENQYNYVVFENLPRQSSSAKAVNGAFKLLKRKGKIISFSVPSIEYASAASLPKGIRFVESSVGLQIFTTMSMYLSFANNSTNNDTSFLEACGKELLEFFALDPKESAMEFNSVMPNADMWPKKYHSKNEEDEKLKMIITRI
ncbi:hypothetical protein FACS1894122_13260 [Alphaproteobacteria bacterium]|nr:hypothetical protein FACS1894122_13260 [Alphaproteobacteria bacterium]